MSRDLEKQPPLDDPLSLPVAQAGRALRDGSLTSAALTRASLARIHARDPELNAFITVTQARALADAARADAELARGIDRGPMHGIPYALKDIYDTEGILTTCHSKLLLDNIPGADSVVAARLREGGAVLMGKTSTHEFATGGPSFDLPFPPARNPWNREHIPGGSSSGSGVAIGAGMLRVAMGSDTAGSIRNPAAYCGIVGLKPTYGLVSRRGVFPLSYTMDHCGPLARTVEDAAIALQVVAGHDTLDPGSADFPIPDYRDGLEQGVAGLRIAVARHMHMNAKTVTQEAIDAIDLALDGLRAAGAIVEDVVLPDYELFFACGRVIIAAEGFAIHQREMGERPLDFGDITFQRKVIGAGVTATDLVQAFRVRRELTDAVSDALGRYDAIVMASSLSAPPPFNKPRDFRMAGSPTLTMPANVSGHPALCVPIGFGASGLPLSLQVIAGHFQERMALRVGRSIEKWNDARA
jgi:aspartyl-tRNA(Asn)/glutamyl-tRNA(Gln) amidotransferase subunit A